MVCSSWTAPSHAGQLDAAWDVRVWIEVEAEQSVRRGTQRDADMAGGAEAAERLHRDRYLASELLYLREVDPRSFAQVVIDNNDIPVPRVLWEVRAGRRSTTTRHHEGRG